MLMRPSRPKQSLYQVPEAGKEGSAVLPWPPFSGFEWMAVIKQSAGDYERHLVVKNP